MAGTLRKLRKSLSLKLNFQSDSGDRVPSDLSPGSSETNSRSSSASGSLLYRSISSRFSKKTCAICLGNLKAGQGHAIFTAECSHSFHFNCIAASVKHGNYLCPICRSKWKEIPFQAPTNVIDPQNNNLGRARVSPFNAPSRDIHAVAPSRNSPPISPPRPEPHHFSDDEPLPTISVDSTPVTPLSRLQAVTIKAFPEFPAVSASQSIPKFPVLVSIRAPPLQDDSRHLERAPVDLVTVLDVSGSMAGSKISLLKHAIRFVIQNLGPSDRLSIVAFSSAARRIFPLRRMSESGREDAILAVNSLSPNGGTNIVEGLKKGVRVLEERREQNPVASIMLLSDGRDTYNCDSHHRRNAQNQASCTQVTEYLNLLPASICPREAEARDCARSPSPTIPVYSFGFGSDHDSTAMHAISDASGGTFSFIESINTIQDAFARCIGGLLSVVAQELQITVRTISPGVQIGSIPSGRYKGEISNNKQQGSIDVGNLFADEEREFLVFLSVPISSSNTEAEEMVENTSLLDVLCSYKDSVTKEMVQVEGERVEIQRPEVLSSADMTVCLEVDRQRNRLWVAEGIAEAKEMADMGNLEGAQAVLANRRTTLLSSASAQAGDGLCNWLESELKEIRERMASMELYEHTGRAYLLSGLSSHSWQRATTRGDSGTLTLNTRRGGNSSTSGRTGYETPAMVSMVTKSQILNGGRPTNQNDTKFQPR